MSKNETTNTPASSGRTRMSRYHNKHSEKSIPPEIEAPSEEAPKKAPNPETPVKRTINEKAPLQAAAKPAAEKPEYVDPYNQIDLDETKLFDGPLITDDLLSLQEKLHNEFTTDELPEEHVSDFEDIFLDESALAEPVAPPETLPDVATTSRENRHDKQAEQTKKAEPKVKSSHNQLVSGTIWLSAGSIISRLLGAIYVIPWYIWMGSHGDAANALFSKGYNIYALFLMISTAGIPAAVAKQTSRYNSLNEYGLSRRLLSHTLKLMLIGGVFFMLVMYFGAPVLAQGNTDLIPVMRSLSFVLIIFPCMSVLRGYFQGNNEPVPYAISQIFEQIARIIYMLLTCYIIMRVMNGAYQTAVVHSTFAAFIGVILGMAILLYYLGKRRKKMQAQVAGSANALTFSGNELIVGMIKDAVPFIVVGAATSIYKLVDQYTFEAFMRVITNYSTEHLSELWALMSANPDKLTMVVISIATAMSEAALPLITEKFTVGKHKDLANLVRSNLQLFFFIMMPATVGMIVVSFPLNTVFYRANAHGSSLLIESAITGIFMGFAMVVMNILQGLNDHKGTMMFMVIGLGVKAIIQLPLIYLFHEYGPLLASLIGYLVTAIYVMDRIHFKTQFHVRDIFGGIKKTFFSTLIMFIATSLALRIGQLVLSPERKVTAFILVLFVAVIGGSVYALLSLKNRQADQLIGQKADRLRAKLHIS